MSRFNPEIRAAEIISSIIFDYPNGGWHRGMTGGEILGWEAFEQEWFAPDSTREPDTFRVPRNQRELAGYLASEMLKGYTSGKIGWGEIRALQKRYGVKSDSTPTWHRSWIGARAGT